VGAMGSPEQTGSSQSGIDNAAYGHRSGTRPRALPHSMSPIGARWTQHANHGCQRTRRARRMNVWIRANRQANVRHLSVESAAILLDDEPAGSDHSTFPREGKADLLVGCRGFVANRKPTNARAPGRAL
jgi:hypothetical protein